MYPSLLSFHPVLGPKVNLIEGVWRFPSFLNPDPNVKSAMVTSIVGDLDVGPLADVQPMRDFAKYCS